MNKYVPIFLTLSLSSCSLFKHESLLDRATLVIAQPMEKPQVEQPYIDGLSHIIEFDFDSSTPTDTAKTVIETHAEHLISFPNKLVRLQGSADDKGTADYNFELGKMRAEAISNLLVEMGVDKQQILISSVGEYQSAFYPERAVVISY